MRRAIRAGDLLLVCLDGLIAVASVAISFIVRFDLGAALEFMLPQLMAVACIALFLKPGVFLAARLYAIYWRYVSPPEVIRLYRATVAASIAFGLAVTILQSPFALLRGIPAAVFLVDFLVTALAVSSVRLLLHLRLSRGTQPIRRA